MSRVIQARHFAALTVLLTVVLSFGSSGSAYAAKGGNGQDQGQGDGASHSQKVGATTSQQERGNDKSSARGQQEKSQSGKGSRAKSDHSQGNSGTSGKYDEPQPVSNADANQGGANGQCPGGAYCSTRDGSESKNGNGGGKATGKPCAGCVGKADNKNPRGQRPDGSDHNNGYECDGNNGIGKTNPAHTGCLAGTDEPPVEEPCVPGQDEECTPVDERCVPGQDEECTPVEEPCVESAANPCGEGAQEEEQCVATADEGENCVAGVEEQGGPEGPVTTSTSLDIPSSLTTPAVVAGVEQTRAPQARPKLAGGQLPQTGAGSLLQMLTAAGLALVLAGGMTLLMQRRLRAGR